MKENDRAPYSDNARLTPRSHRIPTAMTPTTVSVETPEGQLGQDKALSYLRLKVARLICTREKLVLSAHSSLATKLLHRFTFL